MDIHDIALLFAALKDGEMRNFESEEGRLRFRVYLPQLAAKRGESFTHFLCTAGDVTECSLQPFRNESTEIRDLKQINKLNLKIEGAEAGVGWQLKVYCAHRAGGSGARLSLRLRELSVWDESFDPVTAADLAALRRG